VIWVGLATGALACGSGDPAPPDATAPSDAGDPDAHRAICGDRIAELGEECDDGNDVDDDVCSNACALNVAARVNATVKWWFNRNDDLGFEGDACVDLDVARVEVELEYFPQPSVAYVSSDECAFRQVTFVGVPAGGYAIRVRPLDADGDLLITSEVQVGTAFSEQQSIQDIDIGYERWTRSYAGSFFFRVGWGDASADCTTAAPPVAQQQLLLEQGGVALMQMTSNGDALDGSLPSPCRPLTDELPQFAADVPWGPAQLTISGLDGEGIEVYRSSFDTFVGAGLSNPELLFDVVAAP